MNRRFTAKCMVPLCPHTTTKNRNKAFIFINKSLAEDWCHELNVEFKPNRNHYCCEDHLDLKQDLINYTAWKNFQCRPRLKSSAKLRYLPEIGDVSKVEKHEAGRQFPELLSILKMQPTVSATTSTATATTPFISECTAAANWKNKENNPPSSALMELLENSDETLRPTLRSASTHPTTIDVAVQCSVEMASKGIMCNLLKKHISPEESPIVSSSQAGSETTVSDFIPEFSSSSEAMEEDIQTGATRNMFLKTIEQNSKMYLGIPTQYFWIIDYIVENSVVPTTKLKILIALLKIKQNDTMTKISHMLDMSRPTVTKSFIDGLEALVNFFQNLIFMPNKHQIKRNLPHVFKIRFSNVHCIIDAFEIEIEKPSDPIHQAQTWSQYKHCNTVKFLIGCTPNGFVSYISKGWGGRISDKALVENSNLLDVLPENCTVMADRGFKEIESLFISKGIKLLRPPSVYASQKPTEKEVIQTKVIASLRVHVERVIRRVREFQFLKPHAVVAHQHLSYLDEIVIIACGLLNLQSEIIKRS